MEGFLTDFSKADFTSSRQHMFYDYWLEIKGDRLMPSRSDFSPFRLPRVLSSIIMVDVFRDPLRFKCRLMGTECVNAAGFDPTGQWVDEIANTDKILERYQWLVDNKKPYFSSDNVEWANKNFKSFTSINCPFSTDGENVDLMIASSIYRA